MKVDIVLLSKNKKENFHSNAIYFCLIYVVLFPRIYPDCTTTVSTGCCAGGKVEQGRCNKSCKHLSRKFNSKLFDFHYIVVHMTKKNLLYTKLPTIHE